jgi:hypothetical protein
MKFAYTFYFLFSQIYSQLLSDSHQQAVSTLGQKVKRNKTTEKFVLMGKSLFNSLENYFGNRYNVFRDCCKRRIEFVETLKLQARLCEI